MKKNLKILYIGQCQFGSTSKMRYDALCNYFNSKLYLIDISLPINSTCKLFRSLGWRFHKGPLIYNLNKYLLNQLMIFLNLKFDIIWIDKASFVQLSTVNKLKKQTNCLIHYTPDIAFVRNASPFFKQTIHLFDYCITTKSFEIELYKKFGANAVALFTQGFDPKIHFPCVPFENKSGVIFIGLFENYRGKIIQLLIDNQINVKLAGFGWNTFVRSNVKNKYLQFLNTELHNEDYAYSISSSLIGLGLLSQKFPELHTTRTFEIPACGTALITPFNFETSFYFDNEDVIFYNDENDFLNKIKYFLNNKPALKELTDRGRNKVVNGSYSYDKILSDFFIKNIFNN